MTRPAGSGYSISLFTISSQDSGAVGFGDVLGGDGVVQVVDDGDGLGAFPSHEVGGAQEGVGHGGFVGVLFGSADEKEDDGAIFPLVDVSLAGFGFRCGGALALPVEGRFIHGVVFVKGGIGEFFFRLIEGYKEYVGRRIDYVAVFRVQVFHAFTDASGLSESQGGEELVSAVVAVDFQGRNIGKAGRFGNNVDMVVLPVEQFFDFLGQFLLPLKAEHRFFRRSTGPFTAFGIEGELPHAEVFFLYFIEMVLPMVKAVFHKGNPFR